MTNSSTTRLGLAVGLLLSAYLSRSDVQAQTCTPIPSGLISWWRGQGNGIDTIGGQNLSTGTAGFVAAQVGLGNAVANLPANAGSVVIMESDQLDALQTLMRVLNIVATWLWIIAIACWALAVYLSPGRRLKTLRGIAFGLLVVGLGVLAILRVGEHFVVDSLAETPSVQPAATNVIDIVAQTLRASAWSLTAIAILMLLGTWLAGPGARATGLRRWSAPTLREHPEFVWGTFAFIVLLVLIWGPTQATRDLLGIVVFVGLAALGLWAFRRLTVEEFPEATRTKLDLRGAIGWGRSRDDDRVAQLERFAALHEQGALTDEEFEAQKTALLGPTP